MTKLKKNYRNGNEIFTNYFCIINLTSFCNQPYNLQLYRNSILMLFPLTNLSTIRCSNLVCHNHNNSSKYHMLIQILQIQQYNNHNILNKCQIMVVSSHKIYLLLIILYLFLFILILQLL